MTWNRGLGKWGYRWVKWKRISMRKYSLTFLMFIVYAIWYQYEAIYIRSHILDIRMGTSTHQWPLKKQKLYQTLLYQTAAWIAGSECTKFWHSTFYMHLSLNQHRLKISGNKKLAWMVLWQPVKSSNSMSDMFQFFRHLIPKVIQHTTT